MELRLRRDQSGVYPGMDFATRDRCRRAVEELARRSARTEEQVAGQVVALATQAQREGMDGRHSHVGFWLIGDGCRELAGCWNAVKRSAIASWTGSTGTMPPSTPSASAASLL